MKDPLLHHLGHLVGLKRRFHAAQSAILALLAVAGIAGLAAGIDCLVIMPAGVRIAALALAVLAAAALVCLFLIRPTLGFNQKQAARTIETAYPGLGQQLRTALELAKPPAEAMPCNPVLAQHLLDQATQTLATTGTAPIAPWRALRVIGVITAIILAMIAISSLVSADFRTALCRLARPTAPITFTRIEAQASAEAAFTGTKVTVTAKLSGRIPKGASLRLVQANDPAAIDSLAMACTAPGTFAATFDMPPYSLKAMVAAGDGRSRILPIRYVLPLQVRETSAVVTPPAYTLLPASTIKPAETIKAPQGSSIAFAATLSNPIREAILKTAAGGTVITTLQLNTLHATLPMPAKPDTFRILAKDTDGQELQSPIFRLDPIADTPPAIAFITPSADLEANPLEEIPIRVRFKDNYGLKSATILAVVDGQEQTLASQAFTLESKTREITLDTTLLLEKYDLSINSNVKLYAAATDHNPQARGRAVSPLLAIDIRQLQTFTKKPKDGPPPPDGGQPPPEQEQLMKVEEIIRAQREINSLTFIAAERDDPETSTSAGDTLAGRQDKLREDTDKLAKAMMEKEPDKVLPIALAIQEMDEAAGQLRAHAMRPAMPPEDNALTDLLKTRQELLKELKKKQQSKSKGKPKKEKEDEQKPAADLAADLDKLAQEETSIRQDLAAKEASKEASKETLPERQEKVNAKLSEIHEDLLRNKDMTHLVKQRAEELQNAAETAKKALSDVAKKPDESKQAEAEQKTDAARQQIRELAGHVRALDPNNLTNTLKDAADMAKDLANQVDKQEPPKDSKDSPANQKPQDGKPSQPQNGKPSQGQPSQGEPSQGDSKPQGEKSDKPQDGKNDKPQGEKGDKPQDGKNDKPQDGKNDKPQDGKNDKPQGEKGDKPQDGKSDKPQGEKGDKPQDGKSSGKESPSSEQQAQAAEREAETLADILNQAPKMAKGSDPSLSERMEEIRDQFKPNTIPQDVNDAIRDGDPKTKEDLAKLLNQLSKRVAEEHQRAATGLLDRLNKADKEAGELKDKAKQPAGEPKPGEPKPGEPKPGEPKPGQQPGGQQPGGEPKPGPSSSKGEAKNMTPEERMAKLARELKALPDKELKDLGKKLAQNSPGGEGEAEYKPGQGGVLPAELLAEIQRRLRLRIAEELKKNILKTQEHQVPAEYRRLVEEYFKSLSDDIED